MADVVHLKRTAAREDGAPDAGHAAAELPESYRAGSDFAEAFRSSPNTALRAERVLSIIWRVLLWSLAAIGVVHIAGRAGWLS